MVSSCRNCFVSSQEQRKSTTAESSGNGGFVCSLWSTVDTRPNPEGGSAVSQFVHHRSWRTVGFLNLPFCHHQATNVDDEKNGDIFAIWQRYNGAGFLATMNDCGQDADY